MDVESLHLQLLWPLRLDGLSDPGGLDHCVERLESQSAWQLQSNPFQRGPQRDDELMRFAEMAYFHPFVRALLFEKGPAAGTVRVLERHDVRSAEVTLYPAEPAIKLEVYQLQLYLFDTDVAVLAVGLRAAGSIGLSATQDLLDAIRRAYQSYWEFQPTEGGRYGVNSGQRCHCPHRVVWKGDGDLEIGDPSSYGDAEAARQIIASERCEPPVSAHWASLLQPLQQYANSNEKSKLKYRQVVDERIPLMAHVGVARPDKLTRGDFVRLGLLDDQGPSDTLPYGTEFLADFEKRYCYDRFWDPTRRAMHRTRYLCAGYSFVAVGEWLPDDLKDEPYYPGFFMDGRSGGLAHFKHHYFQLGLLAHLQEASLLNFLEDLSDIAAELGKDTSRGLAKKVRDLRQRLTRFVALYWFTEVSNHEQAKELFDLWRGHLASERLYREVLEQTEFVDRALTEQWQRGLEKLASFGVPAAVVFGFLGMSAFVEDWDEAWAHILANGVGSLPQVFDAGELAAIIFFSAVIAGLCWLINRKVER